MSKAESVPWRLHCAGYSEAQHCYTLLRNPPPAWQAPHVRASYGKAVDYKIQIQIQIIYYSVTCHIIYILYTNQHNI